MIGLHEDVAEMFARLEGCGLPTMRDADGEKRAFGFSIVEPEKEAEAKRAYQREYEQRPGRKAALALWRKNNRDKINASARARKQEARRAS